MPNGPQKIGGATPTPRSNPTVQLPKDASREQVLRAIRRLTSQLERRPTLQDAQRFLGVHFTEVASTHFGKPNLSIAVALSKFPSDKKASVRTLMVERDQLAMRLGRNPTAADIDDAIEISPAIVFKLSGVKLDAIQKAPPENGYAAGRATRGTFAEQSKFVPRSRDAFQPTADFKGHPDLRAAAAQDFEALVERAKAIAIPMRIEVPRSINGSDEVGDRPDPVDSPEEVHAQRARTIVHQRIRPPKKEKPPQKQRAPKKVKTPTTEKALLENKEPPQAKAVPLVVTPSVAGPVRRSKPALNQTPALAPAPDFPPTKQAPSVVPALVQEAKSAVVVKNQIVMKGRRMIEIAPVTVDDPSMDGRDPIATVLKQPSLRAAWNPPFTEFADYLARYGNVIVPRLWRILNSGKGKNKLSTEVVMYFTVTKGRNENTNVYGLRLVNAGDLPPGGLSKDTTELRFKYSPNVGRYMLTQARGVKSIEFLKSWLVSQGIVVKPGLETHFLARAYGTIASLHPSYDDMVSRVEAEGGAFFERLWTISHPGQPLPRRIALAFRQREVDGQLRIEAMRFENASKIDKLAPNVAWVVLEYSDLIQSYAVKSAGYKGGQGIGFAWFRSQKVDTSRLSVRLFIARLWNKTQVTEFISGKDEKFQIPDLKADLEDPAYVPGLLRARALLEPDVNRETSSVTVVTRCPLDIQYKGLTLYIAEESAQMPQNPNHTRVVLGKTADGNFVTTSAVGRQGKLFLPAAAQDLPVANVQPRVAIVPSRPSIVPMMADDPATDGKDPAEVALITTKLGDPYYPRRMGVSNPSSSEFSDYVGSYGNSIVERFWRIQEGDNPGHKLSNEVVIYFYVTQKGDAAAFVNGLHIVNASEIPASGLPRSVTELHFKYSPNIGRYILSRAKGADSIDYITKWLESQGVVAKPGLETSFLARTFETKTPFHNAPWNELESRVEKEGGAFFERLWSLAHPGHPHPKRIAFAFTQRGVGAQLQADAMRFEDVNDLDKLHSGTSWVFLEHSDVLNTYVVKSASTEAGQHLGFAWFRSQNIDTSRLSMRVLIGLLWNETRKIALTLGRNETPQLSDLKADLANPRYIPDALRVRQMLNPDINLETSSITLVTQCKSEAEYSGLRLLTAEEGKNVTNDPNYTRVVLGRTSTGKFVATSAKGRQGKQFLASAVQLNDVTHVAGRAAEKTWSALEHRVKTISSDFVRGGVVMFLGDKVSDVILTRRLPKLEPLQAAADYTALAVGNAAGDVVATNLLGLPADSVLTRGIRTLFAMAVMDYSHTGTVNWAHLPVSAATMMVSSGVVSGAKMLLCIGKVSVWGAVATTVVDMTLFKTFSQIQARIADAGDFNASAAQISEMVSVDQEQLKQLVNGEPVSEDDLRAMDRWLQDGEQKMRSRPSMRELQVAAEYAQKLETVHDHYQTRMRWGIYAWFNPETVTRQYIEAKLQIESERDSALKHVPKEDRTFTPLLVDPEKSDWQRLDQVDEDELKADVDVDGVPQHPESVLQVRKLLAHNGKSLADQLARYRQERTAFIAALYKSE